MLKGKGRGIGFLIRLSFYFMMSDLGDIYGPGGPVGPMFFASVHRKSDSKSSHIFTIVSFCSSLFCKCFRKISSDSFPNNQPSVSPDKKVRMKRKRVQNTSTLAPFWPSASFIYYMMYHLFNNVRKHLSWKYACNQSDKETNNYVKFTYREI